MNFVVGRAVYTSVFVSLSVGEITEERIAQEVLKFKILLTSSGAGAVCGDENENLFQAIVVSGSVDKVPFPEPDTLEQMKMLKRLEAV